MPKVNIRIIIDSHSRDIEYCQLESYKLEPKQHFNFKNGQWEAYFANFPIESDLDLDLLIVTSGTPNVQSELTVFINNRENGPYRLYKPFNRSGYSQFNEEIPV